MRRLIRLFSLAAVPLLLGATPLPGAPEWLTRLAENPLAPRVAPKVYDLTIIEFFDYNCPYCKAAQPVLDRVTARDGHIRVVYRDWPVLGPASVMAARVAIAAQWQGAAKHIALHRALLATQGRVTEDVLKAAAARAGLDWVRLERDQVARKGEIDALLAETWRTAEGLGLQGTPGFIVGRQLAVGALGEEQLRGVIARARVAAAQGAI